MVTVAVQIDSIAFDRILKAVKARKYASPHDFMVAAAWNQLALDDMTEPTAVSQHRATEASTADAGQSRPLPAVDLDAAGFAEVPPLDDQRRVLWGQVNRVFPIALGLRALGHLTLTHPDGVPVELWHEDATNGAIGLRARLKQWDEEAGRVPGMRWAIGMPEATPESRHRYMNQFLGIPKPSGIADGACLFLGLAVARQTPEGTLVLPSAEGARWAGLTNPVLDSGDGVPRSTFSDPEVEFYVHHLERYRTAESNFMRAVGGLVAQGHSREELDSAIAESFPEMSHVSSTMRAGVLGRMSDLGLVERVRSGSKVEYRLTSLAIRFGFGSQV